MGRSSGACFKIMTCAKDPDDNGGGEDKVTTDKPKWSFRRRSSKNLLNNISNSGLLSMESNSKASPEAGDHKLREPGDFSQALEKVPALKLVDEKPPLPSAVSDSTKSDAVVISKENKEITASYQESVIVVIQSAARRYLAYKEFIKLKNVVKLQAAVRGYLVRRQAVGTLRCVQAILKLQALLRARPHHGAKKKPNREGKENFGYGQNKVHYSIEKLQATTFSCQLLASIPTKKPIYISCDPLKSTSSWMWLERWMTLASSDTLQHELGQSSEFDYREEKDTIIDIPKAATEAEDPSSTDNSEPKICQSDFPSKDLPNGSSHPDLQVPMSMPAKEFHEPISEEFSNFNLNNIELEEVSNFNSDPISAKSDGKLENEAQSEKQAVDIEKSKRTIKRMTIEFVENENKKSVIMPKRSCNPAFAAMQSKFEELSAAPSSDRLVSSRSSSFHQDTTAETKPDNIPCLIQKSDSLQNQIDKSDALPCVLTLPLYSETNFSETAFTHQATFQTANSECGTEISISSTLDSPDRSEAEGGEIVLEIGTLERRHFDANDDSSGTCMLDHTDDKANAPSSSPIIFDGDALHVNAEVDNLCNREILKSDPENISVTSEDIVQKREQADGNSSPSLSGSFPGKPLLDEKPKSDSCENATGEKGNISSPSPQASPRSHITAAESHGTPASHLESHGTPASEVSGNVKIDKRQTNLLEKKLSSQFVVKRSLENAKNSGGKDKTEPLHKDSKNSKRRNSSGMVKPDFLDNEPRLSNSNSLPNYMQATESAKAKLQAINSPKSSPDVDDKESHTKKRHSLPIGNAKQTSPHMQRSTSHVQNSKENNKRSPNVATERKWQR